MLVPSRAAREARSAICDLFRCEWVPRSRVLATLVARGLVGVELAISDAHPGLKAALATVLGAPWQRCTVHFLRDLHGHVRRNQHDALGAIIRSIFTAPDGDEARRRLRDAVTQLERRLPKIAALLDEAGARRAGLLRLPGRALAQDALNG